MKCLHRRLMGRDSAGRALPNVRTKVSPATNSQADCVTKLRQTAYDIQLSVDRFKMGRAHQVSRTEKENGGEVRGWRGNGLTEFNHKLDSCWISWVVRRSLAIRLTWLPSVMGPTCLLCALFRFTSPLFSPLSKFFLHSKLKPTKLLFTRLPFWPWISLLFSPSVKFCPHYICPSSGLQTLYSAHRLKYSADHGSF